MGKASYSSGNSKGNNRSALLSLLNERGAMSRKDLAHELGVTAAAVTAICADLLAAGVLTEEGVLREERRVGRKKIMVGINYRYRYALAVTIETLDTTITISDLKGDYHMSTQIRTNISITPEQFLDQIAEVGLHLMETQNIPMEMLLGVGVSIPGAVNRKKGIQKAAYSLWDRTVDLRGCLQKYFSCPILVENNINAIAKAEMIFGCGRKYNNLFFLKWGPGVGSAMVIQNQLYESNISKECEIGHVKIEANGVKCHCGRTGCLETRVSVAALVKEVRQNCTPEIMPLLYEKVQGNLGRITEQDLNAWFEPNEPALWEIMDKKIGILATVVGNVITVMAPDAVLLNGPMFDLPQVTERFQQCCQAYDARYDAEYLHRSDLRAARGYIGPVAMVTGELFLTTREIQE